MEIIKKVFAIHFILSLNPKTTFAKGTRDTEHKKAVLQ
jgi:hypothetical protein